jgi:hypothetical protein
VNQHNQIHGATLFAILWHVDSLLGNNHETNNKAMVIARQQLCKYATLLKPLLGSGLHATMEVLLEVVFSMCSALTKFSHLVQCSAVEWSELVGE